MTTEEILDSIRKSYRTALEHGFRPASVTLSLDDFEELCGGLSSYFLDPKLMRVLGLKVIVSDQDEKPTVHAVKHE